MGIAILGGVAGIILGLLWKARNYLLDGTFNLTILIKENLSKAIWALLVVVLLNFVFVYFPESIDFINFLGINLDTQQDISKNLSPVLLGLIILYSVYDGQKTIKKLNKEK